MRNSSRPVHSNVALARFLRRHHGAISVDELRHLGLERDAVTELVRRERLLRQHRGVYRSGDVTPTHETLLRCALLAVGPDAAIARASVAHYRGHLKYAPKRIELVVPRRSVGRQHEGLLVHEARELPPRDLVTTNGLRMTTAHRMLLDMAMSTRTGAGYKLLRRAARESTVEDPSLPSRLAETIKQREPFRGSRILSTVLDEHLELTARTRSELEIDFLDLVREAGLPAPETNTGVMGYEVDAVWRDAKVIVELDTYGTHGGVRPFERDRERDADLLVDAGFRGIRVTDRRMARERAKVKRQLRSLLRG